MDILIKNMEMPKACITGELPNYVYCPCFGICSEACGGSERPSACPLVALPEHGTLKDTDFMLSCLEEIKKDYPEAYKLVSGIIERTPTIVEANV